MNSLISLVGSISAGGPGRGVLEVGVSQLQQPMD